VRSFQDAASPAPREWSIDVDLDLLTRVAEAEETKGVGLLDILDSDSATAQRCARDVPFLAQLLWQCVRLQAEQRGVGKSDFLRALKGNAFTAAGRALQDAAVDFFDDQKRDLQRKILTLNREMEAQMLAGMQRDADRADPAMLAEVMVDVITGVAARGEHLTAEQGRELFAEAIRKRRSGSVGNSPDGSGSIPPPTPSVNSA
jgi:hypothetical protein